MSILVREGSGGNGAAGALSVIMFHNGNTGGTGMDSLFCSDIGLNPAQLLDIRVMGMENQGIVSRIPRYG